MPKLVFPLLTVPVLVAVFLAAFIAARSTGQTPEYTTASQAFTSSLMDSQESRATSPHKHLTNDYVVDDDDEVYDAYTAGTRSPVPTVFVSPVPDEPIRPTRPL
ncbi:uncharacterized protein ARMOST_17255 [Armillaria ostoyae]|uniref:Secreted protein n=1 Tax=Armillaria ostoyae TaxID=47428 RepID=A0A284RYL4_ARMOS|nr:uncharacterized protein ARMOST_17255 [Armillaria ostoyae]